MGAFNQPNSYWPTGGQPDQFGVVPGSLSAGIRAMQGGQPQMGNDLLRMSAGLQPQGGKMGGGGYGGKMGGGGQFNQGNASNDQMRGGGQQFGNPMANPLNMAVGRPMMPMQPGAGYDPMGRGQTPGFNAPPTGGYGMNMVMPTGPMGLPQAPMSGAAPYTPPPPTQNYQGGGSAYQQFTGRPLR